MSLIVITGMSGSGKSNAIDTLEDVGYYCIDNLPPHFLVTLAKFSKASETVNDLALVVDARSKDMFAAFEGELKKLKKSGIDYKLIFIDCDDQVLMNRYKETRRKHPLMDDEFISLKDAIGLERKMMKPIKESADYLIDTTHLTPAKFKQDLINLCIQRHVTRLQIKLISFGYKYGLPTDADIVFDVRCLPNPFYVPHLKDKTGNDEDVYDYVFSFEQATTLRDKLFDLLKFSVPLYVEEGKSQLVIAIGCTGGKHRSISFVNYLSEKLRFADVGIVVTHRDIDR